jgi:mitochondrial chaperone BCS1
MSGADIFSGGLALAAFAAVVAFVRRHVALALRALFVEVEVRGWDEVMWLGLWLSHTTYGKRCRKLATRTIERDDDADMVFEPGLGPHLFRYAGTWVLINRQVDKEENVWSRREWFSVRVLGSRDVATKLIEDAKTYGREVLSRRHTAYLSDGKGEWRRLPTGQPRRISTVVLPGTVAEDVLQRARTFIESGDWYAQMGIAWRIGFGFWGPPRTGKTLLAVAIASELRLPLYYLDLASKDLTDRELLVSLSRVPSRAVLLVEDLDSLLREKEKTSITLAGLLNGLDGALATEGRILIVTSNTREALDPALLGKGRIDVDVHFDYATRDQARRIFLRFFPNHEIEADQFAAIVPDRVVPAASIQEHLVARRADVQRAVAEAHLLAGEDVRAVVRDAEAA